MSIVNIIHYTRYSVTDNAAVEHHTWFLRDRKLTVTGAQRILRRIHPGAVVTRVETFLAE